MDKKLTIWHIVAGVLWAIVSCMLISTFMDAKDELDGEGGGVVILWIVLLIASYVLCSVSMFTQKKILLRIGSIGIGTLYIILFVFLFIGITNEVSMDELIDGLGFACVFFLIVGVVVQIMSYFSLNGLVKKLENGVSIKTYWFRPAAYFAGCFVCMLIALSSLADKYGASLDDLGIDSIFNNWTNLLWVAILFFSGISLLVEEDSNALAGISAKFASNPNNMYNQNRMVNPNMNQYGQQMNQYGQQANQYGQQMNQYGQQQMNQYGQQMNQYGQQQMNQYGQQMNQYGQQMNQYGQQQMNQYGQQANQYAQQANQYGQQNFNNGQYNHGPYNNV